MAALTVLAAISTIGGIAQGAAATSQSKKSQELQSRISEVQAQRSKRKVVREARAERARILNQASQSGSLETSSVATGAGNLQTEAASATSFIGTQTGLATQASGANIKAAQFKSNAGTANAVSSIFTSFDKGT